LMVLALPLLVFSAFWGDSRLMSLPWLELAPPKLNNGSCRWWARWHWRSLGWPRRWRGSRLRGIYRRDWSLRLGDYNVTFGPQYDTVNCILECPFPVTSWDV
jgi:hypothetical protein